MATNARIDGPTTGLNAPAAPLGLPEIGALLVKHYGLHEGVFEVTVEFQIAIGGFGPDPEKVYPSAVVGVSKIGLNRANDSKPGPGLIDAAAVNPRPGKAKSAKPSKR